MLREEGGTGDALSDLWNSVFKLPTTSVGSGGHKCRQMLLENTQVIVSAAVTARKINCSETADHRK